MTVQTKTVVSGKESFMEKKNNLSCALNLTEDSLDKILSLTASCHGGECEISGGEIIYGGSVNFNAIFTAEEINRVEVGAKFTFKAPLDQEFAGASADYSLSDVRVKNEGGMLYAVCDLISRLTLYKNEEKAVVTQADCLYRSETMVVGGSSRIKSETVLDDEFSTKRIKRALYSDAQAIVTNLSAGEGFVTVEGEAIVNVCLLPFSENGDIIKEVRAIPFRFEVDFDGVTEETTLTAKAEVNKTTLKIYVDEDKDSSVVSAQVSVGIECEAVTAAELSYLADAYSQNNYLDIKREPIEQLTGITTRFEDLHYRGAGICKVPEYSRLLKTVGEMIAGYSFKEEGEDLMIEGEIRADALFSDSDNALSSKELVMPFAVTVEGGAGAEVSQLILKSFAVKLKNGETECDASFKASVVKKETVSTMVVTEITDGAEKQINDSAISVYIGKNGDTEWDVIKALGESAESIFSLNPDIAYPLGGGERIIVFRSKR